MMYKFSPAILTLIAVCAGVKFLYIYRAAAMRSLADKLGFQYTRGADFPVFIFRREPWAAYSDMRGDLVNRISSVWNILEGEKNGVKLLVVDTVSNLGMKSGTFATLIAARTDRNPFEPSLEIEKVAHSKGWTAVYRIRFLQLLPWTLSTKRIEEHLNNLIIRPNHNR
jgi:hypothetical protein